MLDRSQLYISEPYLKQWCVRWHGLVCFPLQDLWIQWIHKITTFFFSLSLLFGLFDKMMNSLKDKNTKTKLYFVWNKRSYFENWFRLRSHSIPEKTYHWTRKWFINQILIFVQINLRIKESKAKKMKFWINLFKLRVNYIPNP